MLESVNDGQVLALIMTRDSLIVTPAGEDLQKRDLLISTYSIKCVYPSYLSFNQPTKPTPTMPVLVRTLHLASQMPTRFKLLIGKEENLHYLPHYS